MRAILRPVVEHLLGDSTVVEVVYRDQVVATVIGGENPCVTVVSSHPMWVMDPREMTPRIGPPAPDYGDAGPIGIEVHIDPPAPVEPAESTLARAADAVRRYRRRHYAEEPEEGEAE
jgi:hypothetical protein